MKESTGLLLYGESALDCMFLPVLAAKWQHYQALWELWLIVKRDMDPKALIRYHLISDGQTQASDPIQTITRREEKKLVFMVQSFIWVWKIYRNVQIFKKKPNSRHL